MEPMTIGLIIVGLVGAVGGLWVIGLLTGSSPSSWLGLGGALGGGGLMGFGAIFTDTYAVYSASFGMELGLAGLILLAGTIIYITVLGINAYTDWKRDKPIRLVK